MLWKCAAVLLLITIGVLANFDDLTGDYCGGSTRRCCDGRIDSCAIPILGTLCYCDQFCNRTDSNDCCPDYWSVCLGIQPAEPLLQMRGKSKLNKTDIEVTFNQLWSTYDQIAITKVSDILMAIRCESIATSGECVVHHAASRNGTFAFDIQIHTASCYRR